MAYYDKLVEDTKQELGGSTFLNGMGASLSARVEGVAVANGAEVVTVDKGGIKGPLGYYDNDETRGRWWSSRSVSPTVEGQSEPLVAHGSEVDAYTLKTLSAGIHPTTGEVMRQKRKNGKETVGFDQQLSFDKESSGAWALAYSEALLGNEKAAEDARKWDAVFSYANDAAMEYGVKHGLFITRQGKGGKDVSSAGEIAVAQYGHHTSRAEDPHRHFHNVALNINIRPDGTTGTIDNHELLRHAGEIAAIHRAAQVEKARELFPHLKYEKNGRNVRLMGFPEDLADTWSKRTNTIAEEMEDRGLDKTKHREAAKNVNRNTRDEKKNTPLNELGMRWRTEAGTLGHSYDSVYEQMADARLTSERELDEAYANKVAEAAENGIELPAERPPYDLEEITERAFHALTNFHSTFEDRTVRRELFEELQVHVGPAECEAIYERIITSGKLVQIGTIGNMDEPVFSTPEIIERERTMAGQVLDMKGNLEAFESDLVESIIAAGRPINGGTEIGSYKPEQAAAIRHLCGPDQIAVLSGRAGSGKSFTMAGVKDAHEAKGRTVYGLAPSWKATGVLKEDTQLADEYARAITGWLNRVEKGEITVGAMTTVIVDEAGMVGTDHMAKLVSLAKQTGARLILAGDTRQLQPVTAGAPMKIVEDLNGSAILAEISRQKIDYQLQASMLFSNGDTEGALEIYRKYGNIEFHDDGAEALKALVADYMQDIRDNPQGTRLILTTTNGDARAINNEVRKQRKEAGELGAGIVATTMTRGKSPRPTENEYSVGDRIMFGETLDVGDEKIINNAAATILELKLMENGEPLWTFQMDDGRIITASSSELVGYREKGSNERYPKIAHAYAVTTHSSQGTTVDRAFIYNANGMGKEAAYVAFTRHRWNVKMYVDESRIHDRVAAERGVKMSVSRGSAKMKQDDGVAESEVTREEVFAELVKETSKSTAKLNVCDFQDDRRAWAQAGRTPAQGGENTMTNDNGILPDFGAPRLDGIAQPRREPANAPAPTSAFTPKEETKKVALEAERRDAAAERAATQEANRTKTGKPRQFDGPQISKNEMDDMVRRNLRDYLADKGWHEIEAYNPDGGRRAFIMNLTFKDQSAGKVSVMERNDGTWTWVSRDGEDKGRIWDFVAWRRGGSKMQAMHELRRELGTRPDMQLSRKSKVEAKAKEAEAPIVKRTPFQQIGDRIAESRAAQFVKENYRIVTQRWFAMDEGVNAYLKGRGISEETQRYWKPYIRTESSYSRQNPLGVAFKHTNLNNEITGYERKGPKIDPKEKRAFSKFSGTAYIKQTPEEIEAKVPKITEKGGHSNRRLGLMRTEKEPSRIYLCEVSIDGLSIWQKDGGLQNRKEDWWIASTFGAPSSAGLSDVAELAKRYPNAEFHIAMDNDSSGQVFAREAKMAIEHGRGQGASASIVDRFPDQQFKDWNDQVMGKVWTKAEQAQDENKHVALAAERKAAEEARAKQVEERQQKAEDKPQIEQPRPYKGNRFNRPAGSEERAQPNDDDRRKRIEAFEERRRVEEERRNKPLGM
jgi:conjugative relaxase-like TrwC/TraI family protein